MKVPKTNKEYARGKIRWRFDGAEIDLPNDTELKGIVIEYIKNKLLNRLRSVSPQWRGFAKWLESNMKVEGSAITYPHSDASERFGMMGIEDRWLDEAIAKALEDSIK